MRYKAKQVVNIIIDEVITPLNQFGFPLPDEDTIFEGYKELIQALIDKDAKKLGEIFISICRDDFIEEICESPNESYHGINLVEFLEEEGIDISECDCQIDAADQEDNFEMERYLDEVNRARDMIASNKTFC